MPNRIVVTCKVSGYTNTHSGYCSGNECEFDNEDKIIKFNILVDSDTVAEITKKCRKTFPLIEDGLANKLFQKQIDNYCERYEDEPWQSMYCDNSSEGRTFGIVVHDMVLRFSNFKIEAILRD